MKLETDVVYQMQDMMRERIVNVLNDQGELFPQQVYLHPMQVMGVNVPCYSANDGKGHCHYVGVEVTTDRSEDKDVNGTYVLYFCITPQDKQPSPDVPWGYRFEITPDFNSEDSGKDVTLVRDYILNFLITGKIPNTAEPLQ